MIPNLINLMFEILRPGYAKCLQCLACMPKDFMYHPWQAIMISLCGVNKRKLPTHKRQICAVCPLKEEGLIDLANDVIRGSRGRAASVKAVLSHNSKNFIPRASFKVRQPWLPFTASNFMNSLIQPQKDTEKSFSSSA
ncbi:unnamed protein product [Haemonchus placei]|uniref:RING-type domain-containing protein n=1 Tax=Haemonchus placei TaxID=6290 RepID=A0A0N4W3L1_HAEPC|nr:unnamed protein product [Haemonchus placei]